MIKSLEIDGDGNSTLYPDSVFAVNYIAHSTFYEDGRFGVRPPKYIVERVRKEAINLPLGKAVPVQGSIVKAMRIRENGLSDRPELSNYRFTCISIGEDLYEVTKSSRSSINI